jgi:hypothetical protein
MTVRVTDVWVRLPENEMMAVGGGETMMRTTLADVVAAAVVWGWARLGAEVVLAVEAAVAADRGTCVVAAAVAGWTWRRRGRTSDCEEASVTFHHHVVGLTTHHEPAATGKQRHNPHRHQHAKQAALAANTQH